MIREAIKQRLIDLGVSQKQLAEYIKDHEQNVSAFLNGSRSYSLSRLTKVFDALGLSVGDKGSLVAKYAPKDIRKAIHSSMRKQSLRRKDMARIGHVNPTSVYLFMNGKRSVTLKTLEKMIETAELSIISYGTPGIINQQ